MPEHAEQIQRNCLKRARDWSEEESDEVSRE
jgi:hypothetical protein